MARRTSKRFVAAEGQISLFAMDDATMYEERLRSRQKKRRPNRGWPLTSGRNWNLM